MAKQDTLASGSVAKAVIETGSGDAIARSARNAHAAISANEQIESDVSFMEQDISALVVFLLAVFMTAFIGSWFVPGAWYAALNKPNWTPPNWLFAPVWSLLYVAMATPLFIAGSNTNRRAAHDLLRQQHHSHCRRP